MVLQGQAELTCPIVTMTTSSTMTTGQCLTRHVYNNRYINTRNSRLVMKRYYDDRSFMCKADSSILYDFPIQKKQLLYLVKIIFIQKSILYVDEVKINMINVEFIINQFLKFTFNAFFLFSSACLFIFFTFFPRVE